MRLRTQLIQQPLVVGEQVTIKITTGIPTLRGVTGQVTKRLPGLKYEVELASLKKVVVADSELLIKSCACRH